MKKTDLRNEMAKKLHEHTEQEIRDKSRAITRQLTNLRDFHDASDIFIYISNKEEVKTDEIIQRAISSGKNVYAPMIDDDTIITGKVDGNTRTGKFGITEPVNMSDKNKFDLIIVPLVAFDRTCARLGRGHGYFDRFLENSTGKSIGLAFDFQMCEEIPCEKHDVPLNFVLTERRLLERLKA